MSRSLRIPLFGALTLVVMCFLCYVVFFSGGDEPQKEETSADKTEESTSARDLLKQRLQGNLSANTSPIVEVGPTQAQSGVITPNITAPDSMPTKTDEVAAKSGGNDTVTLEGKSSTVAASTLGGVVYHTVAKGDMISKIAQAYGCKSQDIYDLNEGLNAKNANKIRIGQKIKVKDNKGVGGAAVSDPTPTPGKGSVSVPQDEPEKLKPVVYREPAKNPEFTESKVHTLKAGDGYFTLSKQYYSSHEYWRLIKDANPDWDPFNFEPGETVVIPALNPAGGNEVIEAPRKSSSNLPFER